MILNWVVYRTIVPQSLLQTNNTILLSRTLAIRHICWACVGGESCQKSPSLKRMCDLPERMHRMHMWNHMLSFSSVFVINCRKKFCLSRLHTFFKKESILQESWGSHFGNFKNILEIILRLDHWTTLVSLLRGLRSRVVYKFSSACCNNYYMGETTRHFSTRVNEHASLLTNDLIFTSMKTWNFAVDPVLKTVLKL